MVYNFILVKGYFLLAVYFDTSAPINYSNSFMPLKDHTYRKPMQNSLNNFLKLANEKHEIIFADFVILCVPQIIQSHNENKFNLYHYDRFRSIPT